MRATYFRLLPAFCLALLPCLAQATTMVAMPTERLFTRADVVAVVDVRSVRAEKAGDTVVTHIDAAVAQAFKGARLGARVHILAEGGQVGRYAQRTDGAAEFTEGENCVVFLRRVTDGVYRVVGMEQGKLVIEPGTDGKFVVRRNITARMVERTSAGLVDVPALPRTEPMDSYLATLRRLSGAK